MDSLTSNLENTKLSESVSIESTDLKNVQLIDRDIELEEFAQKFKEIYDNDYRNYLKNLDKNEILYATALPTKKYCKETYDQDSMNSTTLMFYFERLDLDENENINTVVVRTFDRSELCYFTPTVYNEYGLYYKTMLFTCFYNTGRINNSSSQNFFLDLPVYLYNKIDSDN
jgi:hypothetical protein